MNIILCYHILKHKAISIFKIPRAKSGILEHINWREEHMNKVFFFPETVS